MSAPKDRAPYLYDDAVGLPPLDLAAAELYEAEVERRNLIPPFGCRLVDPREGWSPDDETLAIMDAWEAGR